MATNVVGRTVEGKKINYDGIQLSIDPVHERINVNNIEIEHNLVGDTPIIGKIGNTRICIDSNKDKVVRQMKANGSIEIIVIKDPKKTKMLKVKARKNNLRAKQKAKQAEK